jgi:hypothetical protein
MVRGRGGFDVSPLYRVEVEVVVVAASPPTEEEVLLLLLPSSTALLRFLVLFLPPFRLLGRRPIVVHMQGEQIVVLFGSCTRRITTNFETLDFFRSLFPLFPPNEEKFQVDLS